MKCDVKGLHREMRCRRFLHRELTNDSKEENSWPGQVRSGWAGSDSVRLGRIGFGWVALHRVGSGRVRLGWVRPGQVGTGRVIVNNKKFPPWIKYIKN